MANTLINKRQKLTKIDRYTHYLRPEDETIAKSLWNAIQQYNDPKIDPANTPIQFSVRCSAGGDECPAGS